MKGKGLLIVIFLFLLSGCSFQKDDMKKLRDIEYTVVDESKCPEELLEYIKGEKKEPFEITYGDEGYLYIVKGYGVKETSGYSIEIEECFETEDTIWVKTNLLGPKKEEEIMEKETCPYIVLKVEYSDKIVMFE